MGLRHLIQQFVGATPVRSEPTQLQPELKPFDLSQWIANQKTAFRVRDGVAEDLERKARQLTQSPLGISGPLLDELVNRHPRLVPKQFWGGPRGWLSAKREATWRSILEQHKIGALAPTHGVLIRFYIDASEWVPHPYAPPHWAIRDYARFCEYIAPNQDAFQLCAHWAQQNSAELTNRLASRLRAYPVRVAARYRSFENTDYADVAMALGEDSQNALQVAAPWKRQAALAQLVAQLYPDTICEYAPDWLRGQRIDVFVPSLRLAIEFQGEQHYRAIEYFGGKKGLKANRARDERKATACAQAGVILIEWVHSEAISELNLRRKLIAVGISPRGE